MPLVPTCLAARTVTLGVLLGPLLAQGPAPVSFHREVRPILQAACTGCHHPGKKKGGLDLTTHAALLRGGDNGPALRAGAPDGSLLIEQVRGPEPEMPAEGPPLTAPEVALLARWIGEGAKDDTPRGDARPAGPPVVYTKAPAIPALAWSPDGQYLAVAGYHEVLLHHADGSGIAARLVGDAPRIESLAFSPDGRRLVAAGGAPGRFGRLQVWGVVQRRLQRSHAVANDVLYGVSFAPDGRRVAFGCADKTVRVLDLRTGAVTLQFRNHAEWVLATCYTRDGSRLVSAGRDMAMKIIDLRDGRFVDDINNPLEPILALARHPQRDEIAYAGGRGVVRVYRISDNQKRTAARNDTNLVRALPYFGGVVDAVAYNSDGSRLAAGGEIATVKVYDAATGAVVTELAAAGPVFDIAFHPDGTRLAAAGRDGIVRVFAVDGGRLLHSTPAVPMPSAAPPPEEVIAALDVWPARLTLTHGRDERSVIVTGTTADGRQVDLSATASLEVAERTVAVHRGGFIAPAAAGATSVVVRAAGLAARVPVEVVDAHPRPVHFARDVMPILSKAGCNSGSCHGAQAGKNGFALSLRGYDPGADYKALVYELSGRRIDGIEPERSLMLQKPTARVPHEGRKVLDEDSPDYRLLLAWIAEGAAWRDDDAARVTHLQLLPDTVELARAGARQRVVVIAHYADGSSADVTRHAHLSVSDTEVTSLEGASVRALRRGESAVLVRYEGRYATAPVTILGDRTGYAWRDTPEHDFIDEHVDAKLRRVRSLPSGLCSDAEFVRRLYLDLTGRPPAPEEARAFVDSTAADKREALIDALIGSPEYVAHWANKWADLLQCNSETLGERGVWVFRRWIEQVVAENRPYDRFVRELLTATGSTSLEPAASYMRTLSVDKGKHPDPGKMTEDVTQTFLGVRFSCCKCHNHPFERWTQDQYHELSAHFAQVRFKPGTTTGEMVVYDDPEAGELHHPRKGGVLAPRVPFGAPATARTRREALAAWLTSPDNPLFARSYVNRVWSYFFGRGIIEPVDDIRAGNPPSNPGLLDALERSFVESGFDFDALVRRICRSHTWQRSFRANEWNADDVTNFSHALPRRLSAEQLLDAVAVATGTAPALKGLPAGSRAVDAPDGAVRGDDFLALFGRPRRDSACECARTSNLSLAHALNLVGGETLHDAISAPGGRIDALLKGGRSDREVVTELYWAALCRAPTAQELDAFADLGPGEATRRDAAQDLLWALTNSPAFLFNR